MAVTIRALLSTLLVSALLASYFAGAHYSPPQDAPPALQQLLEKGSLTIVTRNNPTSYFEDRTGPTGFEYELASAFAKHLNLPLKVIVADSLKEISSTLESGQADFAAAGLTQTEGRERTMRFALPYNQVSELVIYRRGGPKAETVQDLVGKRIMVNSDSSHAEQLRIWQQELVPELSWGEGSDTDTSDLLQMVANDSLDFTLVDSNEFQILQAYYPSLSIAFQLDEPRTISWSFAQSNDNSLFDVANQFLSEYQLTPAFAAMTERFYGHLDKLDYVGAQHFLRQSERRLGKYKEYFSETANELDIDWRLLAAVSYQESHWNPHAKSFTGVRGMMMLTLSTAKELGVTNRLDPEQSIKGGSLYLSRLRNRLKDVQEPDRTWLALAAYNVGFGHLSDARKITQLQGGNPDLWVDVKEALPLLSQKRYYKFTRHGYARGQEPVDYVQNIRRYYDVLVWNDEQPSFNAKNIALSVSIVPPLL